METFHVGIKNLQTDELRWVEVQSYAKFNAVLMVDYDPKEETIDIVHSAIEQQKYLNHR